MHPGQLSFTQWREREPTVVLPADRSGDLCRYFRAKVVIDDG